MLDIYRYIKKTLCDGGIDEREASSITFLLLEDRFGVSRNDVLLRDNVDIDNDEALSLAKEIAGGEPVQYVIGNTYFCGLKFHVEPTVLIPRPETEELVEWAAESNPKHILDIGTGSGCIAVSLASLLPEAKVEALDVSVDALEVAKGNAEGNAVKVEFKLLDILKDELVSAEKYDCIVSNPPYICVREAEDMEANVLEHEPHLALFVSDDDPLLFYRTIAQKSLAVLSEGGSLFFEINRLYGKEAMDMLCSLGYNEIELRKDQFGNDRMIKAIL